MSKAKLPFIFCLLVLINGALLWYGTHLMLAKPFFPVFHISQLWFIVIGYGIIGLGLSLPTIFLALMFGWLQVILLITGQISPHIKNSGFLDSILLLLHKIFRSDL